MESPYWVTKEVLAYFKRSRQTLDRWRRQFGFPEPVHFAGHPRGPCHYIIIEVLEWAERRRNLVATRPRAP